jgi:hypothetical protein
MEDRNLLRLINLTTFGNRTDRLEFDRAKEIGFAAFVDEQLDQKFRPNRTQELWDNRNSTGNGRNHFHNAWYTQVFFDESQLHLRITQAITEFIVVSQMHPRLTTRGFALTSFVQQIQDVLGSENPTFSDLLYAVSIHGVTGVYLAFGANSSEAITGQAPNEDYAREVMQLFSLGMEELLEDGTPTGIELYNDTDIMEAARIFTGLTSHQSNATGDDGRYEVPMVEYMEHHDMGDKIVMGQTYSPKETIKEEIHDLTNFLAAQHETAVRFCAHMLNRLVTETPSRDLMVDCVQFFKANDGNIIELVRFIFNHSEVLNPTKKCNYTRLRTPVELFCAMTRGTSCYDIDAQAAADTTGRVRLKTQEDTDNGIGDEWSHVIEDYTDNDNVSRIGDLYQHLEVFKDGYASGKPIDFDPGWGNWANANVGGILSAPNVFGILEWESLSSNLDMSNYDGLSESAYVRCGSAHDQKVDRNSFLHIHDFLIGDVVNRGCSNYQHFWNVDGTVTSGRRVEFEKHYWDWFQYDMMAGVEPRSKAKWPIPDPEGRDGSHDPYFTAMGGSSSRATSGSLEKFFVARCNDIDVKAITYVPEV